MENCACEEISTETGAQVIDLSRGLFSKTMKKFVSAILVNLSCSIFNIYIENTTSPSRPAIASNRKYCHASIEYKYFGKKKLMFLCPRNSRDQSSLRSLFLFPPLFPSLSILLFRPSLRSLFSCLPDSPASSSPKSFLVFSHSRAEIRKLEKFATGQ